MSFSRMAPDRRSEIAAMGGRARAAALPPERRSEIAAMGRRAMIDRYFDGNDQAADAWLVAKGLYHQDRDIFTSAYYQAPDPGPHPAHRGK